MVATRTRSADKYAVHELLLPDDPTTPCTPPDVLHESELTGRDIICDADGFWREFATGHSDHAQLVADAGPIVHRGEFLCVQVLERRLTVLVDPCIGYIFREPGDAGRSLVLLGDTHDPSAMLPLIDSLPGPPPALLVHEATDAYIPPHIDYKATRTPELVLEKCVERGHSTPDMAGAFARRIGAQRLVLNHIGSRCDTLCADDPCWC
jgi:ribonuclease Z